MITTNDLKTKGIVRLEENLANQPEFVITVREKGSYVVMKIEHYPICAKWNWKPRFMRRSRILPLVGSARILWINM